jgi:hypothetical protein
MRARVDTSRVQDSVWVAADRPNPPALHEIGHERYHVVDEAYVQSIKNGTSSRSPLYQTHSL